MKGFEFQQYRNSLAKEIKGFPREKRGNILEEAKKSSEYQQARDEKTETRENGKDFTKRLFGHCFEISKINEGDRIPVGGDSIFSDDVNIEIIGDFANIKNFFTETRELAGKYNLSKLRELLDLQKIEVNEKLFAHLFAFTKKFEEKYPDNPEKDSVRRNLYRERSGDIKLSDIFQANIAKCAEIAALAQAYLQREGVSSSYFSGDVLWNRDDEYSEQHSFIIIRHEGKNYIYDPANPTDTASGRFPSIYTTEANFDDEMEKKQKKFITAKNVLSKKEAFYGTNNGTNVWADKHII